MIFRFSNGNLTATDPPAAKGTWEIARTIVQPTGTTFTGRFSPAYYHPSWTLYREIIVQAGGTVTIPASPAAPYRESLTRLAGTGPIVAVVDTAAQATYGRRAATGLLSPIARQADLEAWAAAARGWVPEPRTRPGAVRVECNEGDPHAGARQFLANARPGDSVSVRYSVPQPGVDAYGWMVAMNVTLEPDAWSADVTLAPQLVTT
jgi:hypothetical protein